MDDVAGGYEKRRRDYNDSLGTPSPKRARVDSFPHGDKQSSGSQPRSYPRSPSNIFSPEGQQPWSNYGQSGSQTPSSFQQPFSRSPSFQNKFGNDDYQRNRYNKYGRGPNFNNDNSGRKFYNRDSYGNYNKHGGGYFSNNYQRRDGSYSNRHHPNDSTEPSRHLWAGRFYNMDVDQAILRRDFEPFGELESLNYLRDQKCAFITFKDVRCAQAAKKALETNERYQKIVFTAQNRPSDSAPPLPHYRRQLDVGTTQPMNDTNALLHSGSQHHEHASSSNSDWNSNRGDHVSSTTTNTA